MSTIPSSSVGTSTTTNGVSSSTSPAQVLSTNSQLGQNAFLQLLVTQMKYQNPLSPQSNTQFIAQLAQFSSLEQMTNVAQGEQSLISGIQGLQTSETMTGALQLLGATVSVTNASGSQVTGSVTSVQASTNGPMITVNGSSYPLSAIQSITR